MTEENFEEKFDYIKSELLTRRSDDEELYK